MVMKRVVTILLILLYTVSSVGATVTTHYCAGKVKKCKCGKPAKKDVCCSEKTFFLKAQDTHSFQNLDTIPAEKISGCPVNESITFVCKPVFSNYNKSFIAPKALIDIGPPIYEFICVYLI